MHLFDNDRPKLSSGIPVLLLDGSHVPSLLLMPEPDGMVKVSVMLRHSDEHGGYTWHVAKFPAQDIGELLVHYAENPEQVLKDYFDWTDRRPFRPNVRIPLPKATAHADAAAARQTSVSPLEDLL